MKAIVSVVSNLVLFFAASGVTMAAELYPKEYDATYKFSSPDSQSTIRLTSNGMGKLREERRGSYTVISITDFPGKTIYTFSDSAPIVKTAALQQPYEPPLDVETAKKKNAKYLGEKNIKGLACRGWLYKNDGAETEMWIEKRDNFLVASTSKVRNIVIKMNLVSHSKKKPSPALFALPAGKKIVPDNAR